jgi:drug/metabolite transporter (DMT)-like permease
MTGDRPSAKTVAGVVIGFGGLGLLSLTRGGSAAVGSAFGVAVILFAAFSWATGSFVSGRLQERDRMPANPYVASVYEMLTGGLALTILGLGRGEALHFEEISLRSWVALGYLIIFGSLLGFTSYVWLLGNAPISLVGTYAYVNPAVAVVLGALILSEQVTWATVIGGAIIIAGVGLVVSTERRGRAPGAGSAADRPEPLNSGSGSRR